MKEVKRIAVCLSGQPRFVKECQNFIKDYFLTDGVEIDYFVHSWSDLSDGKTYNEKGIYGNHEVDANYSHLSEKSTIDSVKKLWIDAYSPKSIIVEDEHTNKDLLNFVDTLYNAFELLKGTEYSYENKIYPRSDNLDFSTPRPNIDWPKIIKAKQKHKDKNGFLRNPNFECISQTYSISKSFELKNQYEKENNFEYDLAFRCRSDNMLKPINKKSKLHLNRLLNHNATAQKQHENNRPFLAIAHFSHHDGIFFTGDKIFGGRSKDMSVFEKLFDFRFNQVVEHLFNINQWAFPPESSIGSLFSRMGGQVSCNTDLLNLSLNSSYRDYMLRLKNQSYDSLRNASLALECADIDTMEAYIKNANNE